MELMEIEKTNRMNALFEFYAALLTDKQMNYIELYYADDYSLAEIAEEFGVSRQAVYDNIKRTEKILEAYEMKLHMYSDYIVRSQILMISWKNIQTIAIFRNKLLCSAALIIEIRFKQKVREEMIYGF